LISIRTVASSVNSSTISKSFPTRDTSSDWIEKAFLRNLSERAKNLDVDSTGTSSLYFTITSQGT
jgi:hypothetical protein